LDVLERIRDLKGYQSLLRKLQSRAGVPGLGLLRAARLPVLAALRKDIAAPIVLITDRTDRALTLLDELAFWLDGEAPLYFPEPNPLFYELAAWGTATRRDRLQALTALAAYHFIGGAKPEKAPVLVAPVRAVMTRTLPRRDFIKNSKAIKLNQMIPQSSLTRTWVEIGYQPADTGLEPGQFSHRGGILDVWPPAEKSPVRLEFFGY